MLWFPLTVELRRFRVCWTEQTGKARFCCQLAFDGQWFDLPYGAYDTGLQVDRVSFDILSKMSYRILEILVNTCANVMLLPAESAELSYVQPLQLLAHASVDHFYPVEPAVVDWPEPSRVFDLTSFQKTLTADRSAE